MHDVDNRGLGVVSDVNETGTVVAGDYHWRAIGDDYLVLGNRQVSADI